MLRRMKVTEIPIVDGALGTVLRIMRKSLAKIEIRGRNETIQTTGLLESARILRGVQEN